MEEGGDEAAVPTNGYPKITFEAKDFYDMANKLS
jgi:hypothetical protein